MRYLPAVFYLRVGLVLACLAALILLVGRYTLGVLPVFLLVAAAAVSVLYLFLRAPIEVHDSHLQVGRRIIPWESVSHVWSPSLQAPLVLPLTLDSERSYVLMYPGSRESARKLLHQVRRHARFALIDGLPYRQYWDEDLENFRDRCLVTDQQWNVLSEEDEQEVEQLFKKLRNEGSLHRQESEGQSS
ncbi:MAG: DUF3093 family protein [Bryobacterales bacterium]|nr:DUF3093 family protein [Bryobacterales bacterium]